MRLLTFIHLQHSITQAERDLLRVSPTGGEGPPSIPMQVYTESGETPMNMAEERPPSPQEMRKSVSTRRSGQRGSQSQPAQRQSMGNARGSVASDGMMMNHQYSSESIGSIQALEQLNARYDER